VYSIQYYVIKFVSDRSVVFLRGVRFPPPINLTTAKQDEFTRDNSLYMNDKAVCVVLFVLFIST
jgi:hypothetical protein